MAENMTAVQRLEQILNERDARIKELEGKLGAKGWTVRSKAEGRKPSAERTSIVPTPRAKRRVDQVTDAVAVSAASEIDLRGKDADEAEAAVLVAIDAAVLADLPALRIIHGKGTGVLRERVQQVLKRDTRVAAQRLAPANQGGTGVTIAELVP